MSLRFMWCVIFAVAGGGLSSPECFKRLVCEREEVMRNKVFCTEKKWCFECMVFYRFVYS